MGMKPPSKSWRQARMMWKQSAEVLPEGVARRIPREVAVEYLKVDQELKIYYDDAGKLKPEEECPPFKEPPAQSGGTSFDGRSDPAA